MKKQLYLLGIFTVGLLILGGLPIPTGAQDDSGPLSGGPMPGTYDVFLDMALDNNWISGPTPSTATGWVNTNLRYNLSMMVSPVDQYFNIGFFSPEEGGPSIALDGTFEGSKLFVKIVNDQGSADERLIDWQAALLLGEPLTISWQIPEPPPVGIGSQDTGPGIPPELLPDSFTIPAGAGTPPFPVVRSPMNFSKFVDLQDIVKDYGYEDSGPFFLGPSTFILDNPLDAYDFWLNANLTDMFPPSDYPWENRTIEVVPSTSGSDFSLTLNAEWFDSSLMPYSYSQNMSIGAYWDSTGLLQDFGVTAYTDMDDDGVLDPEEEITLVFDLISNDQTSIPASIGNSGEYLFDLDFSASVDLENDTEEDFVNSVLTAMSDAINEIDGKVFINYTIDGMDGLYYHLDGYMFDLGKFMSDRIGPVIGGGETQSPQPLPPVDAYYQPIGGGEWKEGFRDFAINMFDASPYENTSLFYESQNTEWSGKEHNTTHIPLWDYMPGITNAWVFNRDDWYNTWDTKSFQFGDWSFLDNINELVSNNQDVFIGDVSYVEMHDYWGEWMEPYIINNTPNQFDPFQEYFIALEIQELPDQGYNTYRGAGGFWKLLPMGGDGGSNYGGFGSQSEPTSGDVVYQEQGLFGLNIEPQQFIPMPIRTPDWDVVGGSAIFIEAFVDAMEAIITSPDFSAYLEEMYMLDADPGDMMSIDSISFSLDWTTNTSYSGLDASAGLTVSQADNDTENEIYSTADLTLTSAAEYYWYNSGSFATVSAYLDMDLTATMTDYHAEPSSTDEPTEPEISPGFEIVFAFTTLIALPIFLRKRK